MTATFHRGPPAWTPWVASEAWDRSPRKTPCALGSVKRACGHHCEPWPLVARSPNPERLGGLADRFDRRFDFLLERPRPDRRKAPCKERRGTAEPG